MTGRPPPAPAGGDAVRIRLATDDDFAAIAGLQATSFPDRWTLDSVRRIATLPGAVVLLAERADDGRPVGYLIGQVVTDEAEVHSIAVATAERGRGIGRRLLAAFEATVAALGAVSVVLEVAEDDPVATGLYESAGYLVVARRPGYYRIGRSQPVDAEVRRRRLGAGDPVSGCPRPPLDVGSRLRQGVSSAGPDSVDPPRLMSDESASMLTRAIGSTSDGDLGLAASGAMEVRLAADEAEVDAAQELRYRVFYEERSAKPVGDMAARRRDADDYDAIADHLLVLDHNRGEGPQAVVGTYRLIRRSCADARGGFYTAGEYDISKIVSFPGEVLELGRSCVDAGYRTRPTMQLLWKGIAAFVFRYDITLMFGCASLPGNDVDALAGQLSYLYHHHLAPERLQVRALPDLHVEMNRMPAEQVNAKAALAALPPLIKGYLRLGGFVGDGAVIDPQFNTTDVCVIVQTDAVTDKYYRHYEREARGREPEAGEPLEGGSGEVEAGEGGADGR